MDHQYDLIVIGGGITGLATAYIAARAQKTVLVLEASSNFGGLLQTFPVGDNYLEYYYHHFFTHDVELKWLLKELDLEQHLVFHESKMGIFCRGRMFSFGTIRDLIQFKPLNFWQKFRFAATGFFLGSMAHWKKYENIPASDWLRRWSGSQVYKYIWGPLLGVKFGDHKDQIPLSWLIGRLRQRMKSRHQGNEELGYISGSLKILQDALVRRLEQFKVVLLPDSRVDDLLFEEGRVAGVRARGSIFKASNTIATIPCPNISDLVRAYDAQLASDLGRIKYFGAVCTVLELTENLSDIYWLNIAEENFPFGGIIEHTNLVPSEEYGQRHLVYLSRYFSEDTYEALGTKEELSQKSIDQLHLIYPNFDSTQIKAVHVFKARYAAPICDLCFSEKIVPVKSALDGLYIANMIHVYPDERSVNNSIRVAANACQVMGIEEQVPLGPTLAGQIGFSKSR